MCLCVFICFLYGQSSFVSEEVSEESSFSVNSSCSCHHDPGLGGTTGAIIEHDHQQQEKQEDGGGVDNGSSIEVRNRLDELQERNSALEQDKVTFTFLIDNTGTNTSITYQVLLIAAVFRLNPRFGLIAGRFFYVRVKAVSFGLNTLILVQGGQSRGQTAASKSWRMYLCVLCMLGARRKVEGVDDVSLCARGVTHRSRRFPG